MSSVSIPSPIISKQTTRPLSPLPLPPQQQQQSLQSSTSITPSPVLSPPSTPTQIKSPTQAKSPITIPKIEQKIERVESPQPNKNVEDKFRPVNTTPPPPSTTTTTTLPVDPAISLIASLNINNNNENTSDDGSELSRDSFEGNLVLNETSIHSPQCDETSTVTSSTHGPEKVQIISSKEEFIYEYERWQPFVLWGQTNPGHMLPSDPGMLVIIIIY